MKKRIFGTVIITVIALAAGLNFNQNKNEVTISELALANVEALASGEGSSSDCQRLCPNSGYMCLINFVDGTSISCPGHWK
ncbi:NVEALA domain-containing protein [Parabacteroides sp. APC149_11_2_Y6]